MLSENPHSGFYEAATSRCLDGGGSNPSCNQGGVAVVEQEKTYAMTTGDFTQIAEEISPPLMARDYKDPPVVNETEPDYIVRRLTPTECARLQGFPDWWCDSLGTDEPTEEEISKWMEIWETHRRVIGSYTKPKSRNQIIKWLKNHIQMQQSIPASVYENHGQDTRYTGPLDTAPTVMSTYGTGGNNQPFVVETPKTLKIRSGCEGGGKGSLIQDNKSATLGCNNDQTVFVPKVYGICSKQSHLSTSLRLPMRSTRPSAASLFSMDRSSSRDR